MERFILEKAKEKANHWVCTDTVNGIVCVFENHKFNETQNITLLQDVDANNYMSFAKYVREMADWLRANHYNKIF